VLPCRYLCAGKKEQQPECHVLCSADVNVSVFWVECCCLFSHGVVFMWCRASWWSSAIVLYRCYSRNTSLLTRMGAGISLPSFLFSWSNLIKLAVDLNLERRVIVNVRSMVLAYLW
jgi:hypothetical protein